jgi:hypothetical protein
MFPSLRIVILLLVCAAGEFVHALPGDLLAERIVGSYSGPSWPNGGTTVGMTSEPGEINEAAAPAGAQDRSVWYEYKAPDHEDIVASFSVHFTGTPQRKGVAAYSLASSGQPVEMTNLQPAGASVGGPGNNYLRLQVWLRKRERFILRVWTATNPGGQPDAGYAYNLGHNIRTANRLERGDTPEDPNRYLLFSTGPGQTYSCYLGGNRAIWNYFTTSTEETRWGGNWYPAASASWIEWITPKSGRYRFSLAGHHADLADLLVAEEQTGALALVAPPGRPAEFDANEGDRYLFRIGDKGLKEPYEMNLLLLGGPAEPGDEPSETVPLAPGVPATVRITGASPSSAPLPGPPPVPYPRQGELHANLPDVWFDLGATLHEAWQVNGGGGMVTIYRADAAGHLLSVVAGGPLSDDTAFFAEPGSRYLARVTWRELTESPPVWSVLLEQGATPPVNDRRAGAFVLNTDTIPIVLRGNAAGSTAETSDWIASDGVPYGRSVWYALDAPASPQPWFVSAWNHAALSVRAFREENGTLVSAHVNASPGDPSRFTLHGERIWIMVPANADSRFMLMTGPAVSPGVDFADPLPLTPGARQFHYPGAATQFSVWHTWTATESGLVHFSTRGSATPQRTRIFTGSELAALTEVPAVTYNAVYIEDGQRVESFQAEAGITYRFQTSANGWSPFNPFATWLQPGGWDSPYDVWRQNWPAWEDVPSLADPLADTDGDGLANVMEMALLGIRGMVLPDPPTFPWLYFPEEGTPRLEVFWGERSWALRGPAGCTPFHFIGEVSTDFTSWTAVHEPSPPTAVEDYNHHLMLPRPGEAPARFFRLRVHR